MAIGELFFVTVTLDATDLSSDIALELEARLSGAGIEITEDTTAVRQSVSQTEKNVWAWEVNPTTAVGTSELIVEIFAVNGDALMPVRVFSHYIDVSPGVPGAR